MLRPLALLAGLLVVALAVAVGLQHRTRAPAPLAPDSIPAVEGLAPRTEPIESSEAQRKDEPSEKAAPDARYVGIVGELTRAEDGSCVDSGIITFRYHYLRERRDPPMRKVAVEVDEHGRFEQLFSEPVRLVGCTIEPAVVEDAPKEWLFPMKRGTFLTASPPIDVQVEYRGTHVGLAVKRGLEIRGRVRDERTADPVADALVYIEDGPGRVVATRTDPNGVFRLLGISMRLASAPEPLESAESRNDFPDSANTWSVHAVPRAHRPGQVGVPLPLSETAPAWVELTVKSGFRVSGTVLDSAGKPAAHAAVEVTRRSEGASEFSREVVQYMETGWDGTFEFACVESQPNCELRAHSCDRGSPIQRVDLSLLREDRIGLVLVLPETQVYRIRARKPDGEFLDASSLSLLIRDPWGERTVSGGGSMAASRVALAIGVKSELELTVGFFALPKLEYREAKATLEPLTRREEPELFIFELER